VLLKLNILWLLGAVVVAQDITLVVAVRVDLEPPQAFPLLRVQHTP
jgi:hypothetical protein